MESRQLDALVAQARGWVKGLEVIDQYEKQHEIWRSPNGRGYYEDQLPRVSTDIAEAMGLVEELRERERIAQSNGTSDQEWVKFVWALPMAQHGVHYLLLNLTPEAICLAYLKAKGDAGV